FLLQRGEAFELAARDETAVDQNFAKLEVAARLFAAVLLGEALFNFGGLCKTMRDGQLSKTQVFEGRHAYSLFRFADQGVPKIRNYCRDWTCQGRGRFGMQDSREIPEQKNAFGG